MNLTNSAGIRETVGDAGYPWKHGSLTPRTWGRISPNDYVHNRVLGMDTCKEDRQMYVRIGARVQRLGSGSTHESRDARVILNGPRWRFGTPAW